MAVTAWQGNQPVAGAGGSAFANPTTGMPTPTCYPFSDPVFQNFEVQQYLQVSGVNPAQTYAAPAPEPKRLAEQADKKAGK